MDRYLSLIPETFDDISAMLREDKGFVISFAFGNQSSYPTKMNDLDIELFTNPQLLKEGVNGSTNYHLIGNNAPSGNRKYALKEKDAQETDLYDPTFGLAEKLQVGNFEFQIDYHASNKSHLFVCGNEAAYASSMPVLIQVLRQGINDYMTTIDISRQMHGEPLSEIGPEQIEDIITYVTNDLHSQQAAHINLRRQAVLSGFMQGKIASNRRRS